VLYPHQSFDLGFDSGIRRRFSSSVSVSGMAIEQMEQYAPQALDSFKELAATGHVEFLAETYSHSLSSLISPKKFKNQVLMHKKAVEDILDKTKNFPQYRIDLFRYDRALAAEMGLLPCWRKAHVTYWDGRVPTTVC